MVRVAGECLSISPPSPFVYLLVHHQLADLYLLSRAGIACNWEDNDVVAQEVYYNVRVRT